ncbi:hypothetical protein [Sinisalibacter lacisalsi]|uniref:Uncharacterized protein n=1 Tax=Sinisalibacter lacisalsi TaxID=1526570 RepID=A0ABQ1QN70_9RHOB|nr:hypothetical protein [Sinisalibacter lacisalsi]GGD37623.1 hypothetical protein GCM10011358_21720 [Sinisalibacter lacisalsi]
MSDDPLEFGPDTGLREIWLFTLFVPSAEIADWEPPRIGQPPRDWPLEAALGAGPLDPAHVQVFEAADLGPGGLRRYLADAHGMDEAEVEADADRLDALRGTVAVVLSGALRERPGRFAPSRPANFFGRYSAPRRLSPVTPAMPSASTTGHITPPPGPALDYRRALLLALAGLLALVFVILAFV